MTMIKSRVMGFSAPTRYIQGPGVMEHLEEYTSIWGNRVLFLIDPFFYEKLKKELPELYKNTGTEVECVVFGGEATKKEVERVKQLAADFKANVVVGFGGGKTLDVARCVGITLKVALITMPTAASTDAPTSGSAILYKENGEHDCVVLLDTSPNMVLVDSNIILHAPVRFLVSGMGDALSTWIEGRANAESSAPNYVYYKKFGGMKRTSTGMAIAKCSYDMLMAEGRQAKLAAEAGVLTQALEDIIEVNILMSGLGFENTACAGAHSIADGLTVLPVTNKSLHGEKVAFGCVVQLLAENRDVKEVEEVVDFCLDIGLPITLEDLEVEPTEENIRKVAEASMESFWEVEPIYITAEMVADYIRMADAYVRNRKKQRKEV